MVNEKNEIKRKRHAAATEPREWQVSKFAEKVRGQIEYRKYLAMPDVKRLPGGVLEITR